MVCNVNSASKWFPPWDGAGRGEMAQPSGIGYKHSPQKRNVRPDFSNAIPFPGAFSTQAKGASSV